MAGNQIKFYSKAALPSENIDANGVYFINGGELYKGSQRFGLGRVTVSTSTDGITGAARGDIVATGSGAGWVFDGENWQSLGGDIGTITSSWRADIADAISGLEVSDTTSYVKNITYTVDSTESGLVRVTAEASNFADDVNAVIDDIGESFADSTDSGIYVGVTTSRGSVTAVTVSATDITPNSVTANAITLNSVEVTGIATAVRASGTATDTNLVTEKAVRDALNKFDNAVHFVGVKSSPSEVTNPQAGDIVVIGTEPATEYSSGQEYIYDGTKWELIGDQSAVTGGSDESALLYGVKFEVATAAATAAPTVSLTVNAASTSEAITTANTNVVTANAVADYVEGIVDGADATVSANETVDSTESGFAFGIEIVQSAALLSSVTFKVNYDELKTALGYTTTVSDANSTKLTTEGAVFNYVAAEIGKLDSTVTCGNTGDVEVAITQVDGKLTGVTAALNWIE